MSFQIYPSLIRGLGFTVMKSPTWDTSVQTGVNKYNVKLPQTTNPIWTWTFIYNYLKDIPTDVIHTYLTTDMRVLMDFFLYNQGQSGTFLYRDPDDNTVGPAMISGSPNTPLAELSVITDGLGNYYSPLQRTFGGLFYEDITDLNLDPTTGGEALAVYADGVLQTLGTQYSVSSSPGLALPTGSIMGLYLTWIGLPEGFTAGAQGVPGGSFPPTLYYYYTSFEGASGTGRVGVERAVWVGTNDPLSNTLTLGEIAGGSDAAQTIETIWTWMTPLGETNASPASAPFSKGANMLLTMAPPGRPTGDATGWNLYVSINSGPFTKVNSSALSYLVPYTEPGTGFPGGGASPPSSNTTTGLLQINQPTGADFRCTGWNVWVGLGPGLETQQNLSTIPLSTFTWTEPTSGLIVGNPLPTGDPSSQPTGPVTAQFGYYFRTRFKTDSLDFEKFLNQIWAIGGDNAKNGSGTLEIMTQRPVAL